VDGSTAGRDIYDGKYTFANEKETLLTRAGLRLATCEEETTRDTRQGTRRRLRERIVEFRQGNTTRDTGNRT
jgi:hypothetical protein